MTPPPGGSTFFRQSGHRQQAHGQRQRRQAGEHAFFHFDISLSFFDMVASIVTAVPRWKEHPPIPPIILA